MGALGAVKLSTQNKRCCKRSPCKRRHGHKDTQVASYVQAKAIGREIMPNAEINAMNVPEIKWK